MAQILRNNIIIGTAAIKDLVVSDNSKTRKTVKFVKTVDQYNNISIPYDTFKEFEYGDVVIDNVLYGDIPASGGSVKPQLSYHQTKIYVGHSGLRYLHDEKRGFILFDSQYKGDWHLGIHVGYNQAVRIHNQIFKCVNPNGSSECPLYRYTTNSGLYLTLGDGLGGGYIMTGEVNPDFVKIQEDITEGVITAGPVITYSGNIVDEDGTVRAESLGTTSKPRSVVDTVTVTVSVNGKTATKTVNVYQSENTAVEDYYSIPEFTNEFSYDVFGAVGAESVLPSVAPEYIQTKSTRYSSGEILYTDISTGGVLKFMERDNQNNFTLVNASTGAISTSNRTVPGNVYGDVSVMVTLNGKSSPSQTIQICQEGVQRWYNGSVHTPKDIVSMGLDENGQDRLFTPLAETTNSPLCIFRSFEDDALKFSGSNKDGYILTGETNTGEYTEFIQEPPQ